MSYFSTALKLAIDELGLSQAELCRQTGIQTGQLSKYASGSNDPTLDSLEKLCGAFPEKMRAHLVASHLKDRIPESALPLLRVEILSPHPNRLEQEPIEYRTDLPRDVREALKFLTVRARSSPELRDAIVALVAALRA